MATPAINRKMIEKAIGLDVDQVFLDLEDSVPADRKTEARQNAAAALNELDWGSKTRAVRVNNAHSPWCYRDVVEIVREAGANLDVIIVPKVKGPAELHFFDLLLNQLETELGLARQIGLECLIEQPEAVEYIREIALATPRLEALIFGAADFAAAMGIPVLNLNDLYRNQEKNPAFTGHRWQYVLNRIAVAGRAARLQLIGASFPGYDAGSIDHYRLEAQWEEALGFDGKWAIHPNQVPVAMDVFTPSDLAMANAQKLIDAYAAAVKQGQGAFLFDGQMVDAATVEVAERIVARKKQLK
ncbi:MAG: CoA ester lyase [Bacillota bacterium]